MADDKIRVPNGYVTTIIGVLLTGAIGFNAWAVAAVYDRPTETKTIELIKVHSPYVADKNLVLQALQQSSIEYRELKAAIEKNTRAVIELKATLNKD